MISIPLSPTVAFSPRQSALVNAQQCFPNLMAQMMSQISLYTAAMTDHIERHQALYQRCPVYQPPESNPAFQTLTPKPGVNQSVMIDGQYRLDVTKDGTGSSHFKLYDKEGKEMAGEWGDPHLTGKDGAGVGDLQCNHVLSLPNGSKIGVRVSATDGSAPVPGQPDFVSELTVVSANGHEAMNINMNLGSNKPTTATPISGYLGENFLAETLSDHGTFHGAQLGVSKDGFFDPLTGQPMTAARLREIDMNNADPAARAKATNLAMAQEMFGQGYLTPYDHLKFGKTSFADFMKTTQDECTSNLQSCLQQMMRRNARGCGCAMRLPNHIDRNRDLILQSFGQLPKPYACPTLSSVYNPMMAGHMPEGAACKAIGTYLQQKGIKAVSLQDLGKIANDQNVPPIVRNACSFMTQHPDAWKKVETRDVQGADNWSGNWNFLQRAKDLGADGWEPVMTPPPIDFFYNRRQDVAMEGWPVVNVPVLINPLAARRSIFAV